MGFLDWFRKKPKEEIKEPEFQEPYPKPSEEDKELVAKWVEEINQTLKEMREELRNSIVSAEDVRNPILDKLNNLPESITQPILMKLEETRLPIETLIEEIKKGISDELSKVKLTKEQVKLSKPTIARQLEKRIDQVASSLIPKHIESLLSKTESMTFTELLQATGTTRPTLSKHLQDMVRTGILEKVEQGKYSYYRLKPIAAQVNKLS